MKGFTPDYQPDRIEQGYLHGITSQPGFVVLNNIMRAEADKFVVSLINADAADEATVIARHKLAKAAASYYQAVINRVNEEVSLYSSSLRDEKPVEAAENLDMGEIAARLDLPNLFGGEDIIE